MVYTILSKRLRQFDPNKYITDEGGPSTSNQHQQEFSARLESGEEAQVIQIGKPIPLSSQVRILERVVEDIMKEVYRIFKKIRIFGI